MDMVVIPATSVLYPHYEGPRQFYLKDDRLKINKQLKDHLLKNGAKLQKPENYNELSPEEKKKFNGNPMKLGECLEVDPEDLKQDGIQKLLFVVAPTE